MSNTPPPMPQNREAEEALLASVLIDPGQFYEVSQYLHADDFYIQRHQWVWEAFVNCHKSHLAIEYLTVCNELDNMGYLKEIGGDAFITHLLTAPAIASNAKTYAKLILEEKERRDALHYANELARLAYDKTIPAGEFGDQRDRLKHPKARGKINATVIDEIALELTGRLDAQEKAIPCHALVQNPDGTQAIFGVPSLTENLGGLPLRQSIILGATTQTGKTTLAWQLMEVAAILGYRTLYVATEGSRLSLLQKRICMNLGISVKLLRKGELTDLQKQDINSAVMDYLSTYTEKIFIDDKSRTTNQIIRSAEELKPDLLIVDTLGRVTYEGDNKTIGMGENFTALQDYVKDRDMAGLFLHHIDLTVIERPQMKHLVWARGDLSAAADIVLLMYREDLALSRNDPDQAGTSIKARQYPVPVETWIRKDRDGNVDILCPAMYDLKSQMFRGPNATEEKQYFL